MDEQDALGLDKPIKLGRVSKIPKLTDELLFDASRGLPQVRKNYQRLAKSIQKNDRRYSDKIKKGTYSKSAAYQLKVATEAENLEKVLLFYKLWCHGLFPRANFSDCVQMLRNYKSFPLKEYRRNLINNEIRRLKIEKGIINDDDGDMSEDDLYLAPNDIAAADVPQETSTAAVNDDDDEDWGFLATRRSTNGLFIAESDDETPAPVPPAPTSTAPASAAAPASVPANEDDFDDFDEEELLRAESSAKADQDDQYDEELEIMREMGM